MKYYFNTDFEFNLFEENYNSSTPKIRAIREEFEYLFFWIEENKILKTNKYYSPEYLNYIKRKTNFEPQFEKSIIENSDIPYWGDLSNLELQRKLNSKLTFYNFLKDHPEFNNRWFEIIDTIKSLNLKNYQFPIVIKNPRSFSGMGLIKINSALDFEFHRKKVEKWLNNGSIIIESYLNRMQDFGILIEKDSIRIIENKIGNQFQYQGSKFDPLKKYPEILIFAEKIKEYYLSIGANYPFSIDCFRSEDQKLIFHEVNSRKSMGWIFKQLDKKFNISQASSYQIYQFSKLNFSGTFEELVQKFPENIFVLSPLGNQFMTFYYFETKEMSLEDCELLIKSLF